MSQRNARKRVQSRRAERQRQQQTRLIAGMVIVAVIIVGILIALPLLRGEPTVVAGDYEGLAQDVIQSNEAVGLAIGSASAPVTFVEYSDFSCPHCHDLAGIVHQLIDEYVRSGDLRAVFKPIAFVNPPYSGPAAQAAICAGQQGKFWEMHDQLWGLYDTNGPGAYTPSMLFRQATAVGLDRAQFQSCFNSAETLARVQGVIDEARARGIEGTPAVFINGQNVPYRGADVALADFRAAIERELGN